MERLVCGHVSSRFCYSPSKMTATPTPLKRVFPRKSKDHRTIVIFSQSHPVHPILRHTFPLRSFSIDPMSTDRPTQVPLPVSET